MTAVPRDGPASPDDGGPDGLSTARYDSFVVRVLTRPQDRCVLEGQVTHIATRRTLRFTDLQRLIGFMLAQLGRRPVPSDPTNRDPGPVDAGLS